MVRIPLRFLVPVLVLLAACAPTRRGPAEGRPGEPALPPIPARTGPLVLDLVYPPEDAAVAVRDSTFVFGSTGTGQARLWINETPVPVEPNGAFLAFLPVPPDGVYRLVAVADGDTARLVRRVEVPPPVPALPRDSAVILAESVSPTGAWAVLPGETIEVGFRGTPGGTAWLVLPGGERVRLVETPWADGEGAGAAFVREPGPGGPARDRRVAEYRGFFTARRLVSADTGVAWPTLAAEPRPTSDEGRPVPEKEAAAAAVPGPDTAAVPADTSAGPTPVAGADGPARLELVVAGDTARMPLPLNVVLVDPDRPRVGVAHDPAAVGQTTNGIVIGRPVPDFTYHYFWPNGTALTLTGEREGQYRVRLAEDLSAWVPAEEVRLLAPGTPPPGGRVGTVRMTPYRDAVDVRFTLDEPLPFRVDEGERSIHVTLYGGVSDTDWLQYGGLDPLVEWAEWEQPRDSVYRFTLHLTEAPWGYDAFWAENGDLIVRVRRPPSIDPDEPLRGIRVLVDPGHPPGGAIGPTRFTEAQANLAIALRLQQLLEEAGAEVVMTRTDMTAVPLYARPRMAREVDADILISVHNNAFPDGVNPFENNGTSVYYFHHQSVGLARELQQELLRELGLRDLGIGRGNLALVRPTWMPAALTETMFLMVPRQEAALQDPEVQDRIARAHVRALEDFLQARAAARPRR